MRAKHSEHGTTLWLSKTDTFEWAHRPGVGWPCSTIANRSLVAVFDKIGDLVELSFNGGRGDQDCDSHEFNAIVSDFLRERFGSDHQAIR
jgi:hypothetical protein